MGFLSKGWQSPDCHINLWLFPILLIVSLSIVPLSAIDDSSSQPGLKLPRIGYSAASLVLPGCGEMLLGRYARGGTLMAIDLMAIYAYIETDREINRQRDGYMLFANLYAGVPYGMPVNHYQAVQDFISSDYYNDITEMMARNYYLIYNYDPDSFADYMANNTYTGDEAWKWRNEEYWQEYKNMRIRHQRTKMSHNFALGIMLLNRAVSAIDSALLSSHKHGTVFLTPNGVEGAMLNYQINF